MIVGLDIDGVLADLAGATLRWLNLQNRKRAGRAGIDNAPRQFTIEDMAHYEFLRDQLGGQEKLLDVMDSLYKRNLVKAQEPQLWRRFEEIQGLGHSVTVITRRTLPSHPAVSSWLLDRGLKYNTLIFMDWTYDKLAYPIDVLLDDHPGMLQAAREHPEKTVFLRDQPWNRGLKGGPKNLIRVSGLGEMISRLEEVANG